MVVAGLLAFSCGLTSGSGNVVVMDSSGCGGQVGGGSDISPPLVGRRCKLLGSVICIGPMRQTSQSSLFADLVLDMRHNARHAIELLSEDAIRLCHDVILLVEVDNHIADEMA